MFVLILLFFHTKEKEVAHSLERVCRNTTLHQQQPQASSQQLWHRRYEGLHTLWSFCYQGWRTSNIYLIWLARVAPAHFQLTQSKLLVWKREVFKIWILHFQRRLKDQALVHSGRNANGLKLFWQDVNSQICIIRLVVKQDIWLRNPSLPPPKSLYQICSKSKQKEEARKNTFKRTGMGGVTTGLKGKPFHFPRGRMLIVNKSKGFKKEKCCRTMACIMLCGMTSVRDLLKAGLWAVLTYLDATWK